MKAKVVITVCLDDSGQVSFSASSQNLVTILGLIEIARNGFIQKMTAEKSDIIVPRLN